jgi:transcriptional regulator with XRE-family HTH domain
MAGRKRTELTGTGVTVELARRLRTLRDQNQLTLRQLAVKSGFSHSALSLAESGRVVPSWDVMAAFVQSCGQNPDQWRQLWEVARDGAAAVPGTGGEATDGEATGGEGTGGEATGGRPAGREIADDRAASDEGATAAADDPAAPLPSPAAGRRRVVLRAVAGAAAVAVIASVATLLALRHPPSPAARQAVIAKDGTDPYADHCKADETELDWQVVKRADGATFGTILLMYSPACQAAWGYLDGPNTSAWTTHIVAHRIPGGAIAPSQFGGNAAYGSWGNVLSTRPGCVYIEAYVVDKTGPGPHARTACIQPPPAPSP